MPEEKRFSKLIRIMQKLRSENGCPWDREQTHESLIPYLFEESQELMAAITRNCGDEIKQELGDVLLQIIFHAQIASETNRFSIDDVVDTISEKLIRRHPHVFGDIKVENSKEVVTNWQKIKKEENDIKSPENQDFFSGILMCLPPLLYARKCQERAAQMGFDWNKTEDVKNKVMEEVTEFIDCADQDHRKMKEEFGDLLFSLINLSRFLNIHADHALQAATEKFKTRFKEMISILDDPSQMEKMSLEELDEIWDKAKKITAKKNHL